MIERSCGQNGNIKRIYKGLVYSDEKKEIQISTTRKRIENTVTNVKFVTLLFLKKSEREKNNFKRSQTVT